MPAKRNAFANTLSGKPDAIPKDRCQRKHECKQMGQGLAGVAQAGGASSNAPKGHGVIPGRGA